ncbi:cysteine-rich receptor-like protein kinase 8 [Tanacetum coccineum]
MEIGLSTKRKLGFVRGTVIRMNDPVQAELWDTCNNVVISWIMNSVSDSIAKSIMFVGTASEIWNQLEKRFALSNGSRKYKLNREIYSFEQKGSSINEYFCSQMSKILLMNPLPTVESACSLLQQEESQRELWHPPERCWEKICYPNWHPKFKQSKLKGKDGNGCKGYSGFKVNQSNRKVAATAEGGNIMFTPQQFQQLMRSLPQFDLKGNNSDEELDHTFVAGTVKLNNEHVLKNTLVVPSFKFGLLSVPKITQDRNYFVTFFPKFCVVQDWTTKRVLALGKQRSGLYFLLNIPLKSIDARLQSLIVVTNGKYKYFLTIVDDCSRVTWTYLLVQKSDSFSFLKSFISFVSNQFNKTVKTVRSDNALEFVKGPCHLFLAEQGIVHQTSCADRPQQNARVERKHRHILEIARALRFHSHLPLCDNCGLSRFIKP